MFFPLMRTIALTKRFALRLNESWADTSFYSVSMVCIMWNTGENQVGERRYSVREKVAEIALPGPTPVCLTRVFPIGPRGKAGFIWNTGRAAGWQYSSDHQIKLAYLGSTGCSAKHFGRRGPNPSRGRGCKLYIGPLAGLVRERMEQVMRAKDRAARGIDSLNERGEDFHCSTDVSVGKASQSYSHESFSPEDPSKHLVGVLVGGKAGTLSIQIRESLGGLCELKSSLANLCLIQ